MARASALHAEGQRFESVILHLEEHNDMMEASAELDLDQEYRFQAELARSEENERKE